MVAGEEFLLVSAVAALLGGAYAALRATRSLIARGERYDRAKDLVQAIVDSLTIRLGATERVLRSLEQKTSTMDARQTALVDRFQSDSELLGRLITYVEETLRNEGRLAQQILLLRQKVDSMQPMLGAVDFTKTQPPSISPPFEVRAPLASVLGSTENSVLELLEREGPITAPDVGRKIDRTREHTARLMKTLFEQGFIIRETNRIPYRYKINPKIRERLMSDLKGKIDSAESDSASQEKATKNA